MLTINRPSNSDLLLRGILHTSGSPSSYKSYLSWVLSLKLALTSSYCLSPPRCTCVYLPLNLKLWVTVPCDGVASHPMRVGIFLATSCCRNGDNPRPDGGTFSLFTDFTFLTSSVASFFRKLQPKV